MTKRIERRGDYQEVVGDDLYTHFRGWYQGQTSGMFPESTTVLWFVRWLHATAPGSDALARINDAPRQLFLAFGDEEKPWKEVEE